MFMREHFLTADTGNNPDIWYQQLENIQVFNMAAWRQSKYDQQVKK